MQPLGQAIFYRLCSIVAKQGDYVLGCVRQTACPSVCSSVRIHIILIVCFSNTRGVGGLSFGRGRLAFLLI